MILSAATEEGSTFTYTGFVESVESGTAGQSRLLFFLGRLAGQYRAASPVYAAWAALASAAISPANGSRSFDGRGSCFRGRVRPAKKVKNLIRIKVAGFCPDYDQTIKPKVMALKDFDVNDLEAGREYIEAYVRFFKFAEGEEDEAHGHAHA